VAARPVLPDEVVDAVDVSWERRPDGFLVRAVAPESAGRPGRVLQSFATVLRWSDVRALADGVARNRSVGTDLGGFAYPEAGGPADGVVVYDGGDHEVVVSREAFHRLFSRLLDALVEGASADGDPVTEEAWWPDFVTRAETLRKVAGRPPDSPFRSSPPPGDGGEGAAT
jgi:hypothetical protein